MVRKIDLYKAWFSRWSSNSELFQIQINNFARQFGDLRKTSTWELAALAAYKKIEFVSGTSANKCRIHLNMIISDVSFPPHLVQ